MNMNNAIKDHLIQQQRPLYLQPRRQDGSYPWMDASGGGNGGGGGEAGGPSDEAMDSSGDGAGGGGDGGAASAKKRRAAWIDPTADALDSSSSRTKKKAT